VRAFDVATFVAHGAAQLGIVGSDVLAEFDYSELYAPVDLGIGHCRISVAEPAGLAQRRSARLEPCPRRDQISHITRRHFEARGVQAECVKLNGAMELAPVLGLSRRGSSISSRRGRTLKENGLVEVEVIAEVTARLIVNRAAFKTRRSGAAGRGVPRRDCFARDREAGK
jgi:ATP phosphoribosyltransferase